MNLTMQQPISYPFYMGSPRFPFSAPWMSNPYRYPPPPHPQQHFSSPYQPSPSFASVSYPLPFILSHQSQQNPYQKPLPSVSPYTNMRYNHLKQSTSHINRHRPIDTPLHSPHYSVPDHSHRPSKTKSVSDFQQIYNPNSAHLPRASSWHSMNHAYQPNASVSYANHVPVSYENDHNHGQPYSPPKMKKKAYSRYLSSSPKQKSTLDRGVVRISTYDEMPVIDNPIYNEGRSSSNRISQIQPTISMNFDEQPSPSAASSSGSSHSSYQKRLNGSLRNDPLLTAAMEDFRQLRRTSSRDTSLTPHGHRDLSRDSLCSHSSHRSSSSLSRSHSQSSFTSLERLEIRHLIKTLRTKGLSSLNIPPQSAAIPPVSIEQTPIRVPSSVPATKLKKSSITEELDREFNKIRSYNFNEDIDYIKPSLIQKQKKSIPPLPTVEELLCKVQKQTMDKSINEDKPYENPILSVSTSQGSPKKSAKIVTIDKKLPEKLEPDQPLPTKTVPEVNLRPAKKEEQIRSFSFCKPMDDIVNDSCQTRPVSMFNWYHLGLTNPYPVTFEPSTKKSKHTESEHDMSLVKENIYASEVDVHIPLSNEKDYLHDQTAMMDYLTNYKHAATTITTSSSKFNDFSRIFTRFGNHKHDPNKKLKAKLQKNNPPPPHHHSRCSIM